MTFQVDAYKQTDGFVDDLFVLKEFDDDTIQINDWVGRLEWPELQYYRIDK